MVTITHFTLNGCAAELTLNDRKNVRPLLKIKKVSGAISYSEIDETTANLLLQLRTGFDNRTLVIG